MPTGKIHFSMNVWGAAVSLITLLTGAWLMVAPFALAYQRSGANWNSATGNSFGFGLAIVVVSIVGIELFAWSVVRDARLAGVLRMRRQRATFNAEDAQMRIAALERTLTQMAAVLAADVAAHRNGDTGRGPDTLQSIPEPVPGGRKQ